VEGLAEDGRLHRVQEAFVAAGAVQCGFCTPGLVVTTADLLDHNPDPTEDEIREALSGNLCRCTGYAKIFDAVRLAAS
jgi:carbon-monoxide dehydrogenase small subunit